MDYRVKLAETVQKEFGAALENGVVSKTGPDHNPIITVFYRLPSNLYYEKTGLQGENKRIVLEKLAKELYEELYDYKN